MEEKIIFEYQSRDKRPVELPFDGFKDEAPANPAPEAAAPAPQAPMSSAAAPAKDGELWGMFLTGGCRLPAVGKGWAAPRRAIRYESHPVGEPDGLSVR